MRSQFLHSTLFGVVLSTLVCLPFCPTKAQSMVLTKTRAPHLNTASYKQIAIGDTMGQSGVRTEESLNLTDEISSLLFNANQQEILDRNALDKIFTSGTEFKVDNDATIKALKKKLNNGLLITGRIQTSNIRHEEVSDKNVVVVNGCTYNYYWKVVHEMVVQLKVMDVSAGKMLFNGPVSKTNTFTTKASCERTSKPANSSVTPETLKDLAFEISKIVVPYKEEISLLFESGSIFKNPFKKQDEAIRLLKAGDYEQGLQIFKMYADDNSLKERLKAQASYNYALALFCAEQNQAAKDQLKKAIALNGMNAGYQQWYDRVDKEMSIGK